MTKNNSGIQDMTYFRNTYGIAASVTMFHRLRTWYSQKAKLATREHDTKGYEKYTVMAAVMTAYIKAARNVW